MSDRARAPADEPQQAASATFGQHRGADGVSSDCSARRPRWCWCCSRLALFFALRPLEPVGPAAQQEPTQNMPCSTRARITQAVNLAQEIEMFHVAEPVQKRVCRRCRRRPREALRVAARAAPRRAALSKHRSVCSPSVALAVPWSSCGVQKVEVLGITVLLMLRMAAYTQGPSVGLPTTSSASRCTCNTSTRA